MNNFTSIEEGYTLLHLGVNRISADMYYGYKREKPVPLPYNDVEITHLCTPCWTVGALLEILPSGSSIVKKSEGAYYCTCPLKKDEVPTTYETPVKAAYEMVVWLLKKKRNK